MSETLTLDRGRSELRGVDASGRTYGFAPAMVSVLAPGGARAGAIRALRAHVIAQHISHGRRALAVCGPSAGVGCSIIAANLAVSLSQVGVRTLLIDGDLRRPTLDHLIRPPHPPQGLSECLRSPQESFGAFIDGDVLPDLSLMYAGEPAANSQELLSGEHFRALMNFCLREYDITIVDTPPANTSTDARRIGGVAGYSLIVAARDKTFVRDIKTLSGQLKADGSLVLGSVFNLG